MPENYNKFEWKGLCLIIIRIINNLFVCLYLPTVNHIFKGETASSAGLRFQNMMYKRRNKMATY